jgi:hypothetical protein
VATLNQRRNREQLGRSHHGPSVATVNAHLKQWEVVSWSAGATPPGAPTTHERKRASQ